MKTCFPASLAMLALCFVIALITGCGGDAPAGSNEEPPRPVSAVPLKVYEASASELVSGVVGSWKVEDIGFEVSGRVEYVIEPESMVDGYLTTNTNDQSLGGLVASIDSTRYQTQLVGANAEVAMLERQLAATVVEWERVLPAKAAAATAARDLAEIEYGRTEGLLKRMAVPKAKFNEVDAALKQANADLEQANANIEAKAAEIESLKAKIAQATAAASDAKRDLEDCELRAPFRGQIAEVHVIPGAYVQRGEPVVTLQMMDPIKVEFEVSAQRAKELRYKDEINVTLLPPGGGSPIDRQGIVYQTGTVADAATRTFTITVLIRNELLHALAAMESGIEGVALTRDTWPLLKGVIGDGESFYFEKDAIHHDAQGSYIYRIAEPGRGEQSLGTVLRVEKQRIVAEKEEAAFLGLWTFQRISLPPNTEIDVENDRFVGQLKHPESAGEWDGERVLFQRERWLLRPGDLLQVDLGAKGFGSGFYVPLSAIHESRSVLYVFVIQPGEGDRVATVRRVAINLLDGPNTLRRIEALEPGDLKEGDQIVNGGVHFLVDGEAVKVMGADQ